VVVAVDDDFSGLDRARELGSREDGLAVVVTLRNDGSPQASVVNAGVVDDPVTRGPVVGFVARGGTKKLAHLRARPHVTVVFRSGWEWVAVEGDAALAGPDDALDGLDKGDVNRVIRSVYAAAVGGTEEEWAGLDAVIAAERHAAVLIRPSRIYSNPSS
jgi:PPOX class probable F420-dependent enzyme